MSCGRTFQTEGGTDRKGPGVLKALEGGQTEIGSQFMQGTASQGNVLGFIQWEDDMIGGFKKLLFLARYYCFVSQRILMFSSHAQMVF